MNTPTTPAATRRAELLSRLDEAMTYDLAVIGGGATGLGVAVDAAARGLRVVLVDSHDFAKGTSSRSTKLVHGGVRYLAQGNIALVREALHERATLLHNAPHLAQPLAFVMPSYKRWETPFYGIGLKIYDLLAGQAGLGPTKFLGRADVLRLLPTVRTEGLRGGVQYWDGQFDDARLALALARTAAAQGALLVNYCSVTSLIHDGGRVAGVVCEDASSGRQWRLRARCVVNATGVWVDQLRQMDGDASGRPARPMVAPSQGVHVVVDREFLPGEQALLVPKTADGRVLFAVPWLGKVVLGTTDSPRQDIVREPAPFREELDFILQEAARYLVRAPRLEDVRSLWVGLRPLVRPPEESSENTQAISREHTVMISPGGLVTVTGGKWTTYRAMAEDVLQKCAESANLPQLSAAGRTHRLRLIGAPDGQVGHRLCDPPGLYGYGAEAGVLERMPGAAHWLCPGLTEAMVRFAVRYEYALTVEDMLARRHRLLFLDARHAMAVAPAVAAIMREELEGSDPGLDDFLELAARYLPSAVGYA